jgi:hypothetical protein
MNYFPRTNIGGLSVSRLIIGTNWFLGYSHTSQAKCTYIKENVRDKRKIADILEVFLNNGIDTIMGPITCEPLYDAIREAEDRTGSKVIIISTPDFPVTPATPQKGFDMGIVEKTLDEHAKYGSSICMPHQCTTDSMVDRCTRSIRQMEPVCKMIRERNMIPGLSTHMPESIVYADETGLDVETYISIYNSMGFLMQVEVDWIANVMQKARKPVIAIKPMAAGQLRPFQALTFVWNTIRDKDMVALGTMSPKEAEECIELSLSILEHRSLDMKLQVTRSKKTISSK